MEFLFSYCLEMMMYLLINFVVVTGMRLLERRAAIPGYISGK